MSRLNGALDTCVIMDGIQSVMMCVQYQKVMPDCGCSLHDDGGASDDDELSSDSEFVEEVSLIGDS